MPNKMLVDATHPEETRVVVLRGHRVEEFDFESASRKQLRGNIYLAKVTRVEPSLQAAFVDYGGNRHGFLAFSEIHPDYYQIPVADRQALIAEDERAQRAADAEADHHVVRRARRSDLSRDRLTTSPTDTEVQDGPGSEPSRQDDGFAMAACSEQMAPEADLAPSVAVDTAPDEGVTETAPHGSADFAIGLALSEASGEAADLETDEAAEPSPAGSPPD